MTGDGEALRRALGPLVDLVALTPVADRGELVARVERVVAAAVPVLQVDAVGLTLLDDTDRPRVAAASDEQAALVELEQLACDEGPGIDAVRSGIAVRMEDVAGAERYPALAGRLEEVPAAALLATPVHVDGSVVGSLTASMRAPHHWTDAQARAAAAYADVLGLAMRVNAQAGAAGDRQHRLQQQLDLTPTDTLTDEEKP